MPNAEVFYLKEQTGNYTNGYKPVHQKWEAMKNISQVEYWLYTGAQLGVVFSYEVKKLPVPEEDVAAWRKRGYVVRDA